MGLGVCKDALLRFCCLPILLDMAGEIRYDVGLFAVHDLPCVPDGEVLVFQDKGHGDDFATMWDVILSLLRADWFRECAASCVWEDENGEEDVLAQAGKVREEP